MTAATDFLTERLFTARADTAAVQRKIDSVAYLVGYYNVLAEASSNDDLSDLVRDLKAVLGGTFDENMIGDAGR